MAGIATVIDTDPGVDDCIALLAALFLGERLTLGMLGGGQLDLEPLVPDQPTVAQREMPGLF